MFPGGIADKLGNRYEAKWLVRQLLEVIRGEATSLQFEGINNCFKGFEFAIRRHNIIEWHQTKISSPNGNWTIAALEREGVLSAFKGRLQASSHDLCFFISQDPAKDISILCEKARLTSHEDEFQSSLAKTQTDKLNELIKFWAVNIQTAFLWLKRSEFRVESQSGIESAIATLSEYLFFKPSDSTFEILRDYLERRFNQKLTIEKIREDIRLENKIKLRDWATDPTLSEKLTEQTRGYLDTYIPFGANGEAIPRTEARDVVSILKDPEQPNIVLLTGVAGSGKSGVIREAISNLEQLDIPHLALRVDHHLDCKSPRMLGKEIIDREESPVATLKGLSPDGLSVLIIDQVDAVSEVSGRNGAVKQVVLKLIEEACTFGNIALLISCRTFDLDSDARLKVLKQSANVHHIDVQLLDWKSEVKPLLVSHSIPADQFTKGQQELLRLPLNLSIFMELDEGARAIFSSRNDLFSALLERKARQIRANRNIEWDIVLSLSQMANWMSEQQKLDAPEEVLTGFGGALDLLASEGLIIRSRSHINFFHESFFDYIYAKSFSIRNQSILSLIDESEQHLFRRTQVRQILEALRHSDSSRYLKELNSILHSLMVRYHIKVSVTQWLGSLPDPQKEEKDVILTLDTPGRIFSPLVRHAFFSTPAWFDLLFQDGWIEANLESTEAKRTNVVLWWMSNMAGHRPEAVAFVLEKWWGYKPDRAERVLDWFGTARRQNSDDALADLCLRVIQLNPALLFKEEQSSRRDSLLSNWTNGSPEIATKFLEQYFDAWFEANPEHHPFEREEFNKIDEHSLRELAEKYPIAFIKGSISAFVNSISIIEKKERENIADYSFLTRYQSGHRFGADSFLHMFRSSMQEVAVSNPVLADEFLHTLPFELHEVFTHIWLETIISNSKGLSHLFVEVLNSHFLFEAGWHGADWKSLSNAAKNCIPFLESEVIERLFQLIADHNPELQFAVRLQKSNNGSGEQEPWYTRKTIIQYLNRTRYEQWCVLEGIGKDLLNDLLRKRLLELRRKFKNSTVSEPDQLRMRQVRSPIKRSSAERMSDAQWLLAMKRYSSGETRYRTIEFVAGGAEELAGQLEYLSKIQPLRFAALLELIPNTVHGTYIEHLLRGLAEADNLSLDSARQAIQNAHHRPNHSYGSEIVRVIEKQPIVATDIEIFAILAWYIANGEANEGEDGELTTANRELITIEDLLFQGGSIHVRGTNGVRGVAVEALGEVISSAPQVVEKAWEILERRAEEESHLGVRCCLARAIVPLFNHDPARCALLADNIFRHPNELRSKHNALFERIWLNFAFPSIQAPHFVRYASTWIAGKLERLARLFCVGADNSAWLSPLLTHHGVYLFPYLCHTAPNTTDKWLYRLIVTGNETFRAVGAWLIFQKSFTDSKYACLADRLADDGAIYRRLLTDIASYAVTDEEYRHRAEKILTTNFNDSDKQVRIQAGNTFHQIKPDEFDRYKSLAECYLESKAFLTESWAFFNLLKEAPSTVDSMTIRATEILVDHIEASNDPTSLSSQILHLEEILRNEYTASETDPKLRRRLLDLIDRMLKMELYGVDKIITSHER